MLAHTAAENPLSKAAGRPCHALGLQARAAVSPQAALALGRCVSQAALHKAGSKLSESLYCPLQSQTTQSGCSELRCLMMAGQLLICLHARGYYDMHMHPAASPICLATVALRQAMLSKRYHINFACHHDTDCNLLSRVSMCLLVPARPVSE